MFLSNLSIRRPVFATMMIMALVVLGLFSYRRLSIDLWPDIEFPFLVIQTRYPGASPESVERDVTKKIEEQVNTVGGVKQIQSTSTEGFSTIFVEFNLDTKIMDAQADVRAKLDAIRQELITLARQSQATDHFAGESVGPADLRALSARPGLGPARPHPARR